MLHMASRLRPVTIDCLDTLPTVRHRIQREPGTDCLAAFIALLLPHVP